MKEVLAAALLLSGAMFIFLAALGLVRFPDVFCRSHALGVAASLGLSLILLGLWIQLGTEEAGVKLLLGILFQFATIPVASHLFSLVGYRKKLPLWSPPSPGGNKSEA